MTPKGIESIISSLQHDAQTEFNAQIETAHQKGEERYHEMIAETNKRLVNIERSQKEEVKHLYRRNVRHYTNEAQKEIDDLKNTYVNEVLNEALLRLQNMDDEKFISLLESVLQRENGGQKPRIFVEKARYASVLSALGSEYQVIEDNTMTSGFLLNFEDYDIDYEFSHLFQYNKESFTKLTLLHLFEDAS